MLVAVLQQDTNKADGAKAPWTALLCAAYSAVTAVATLAALCVADIGPRWPRPNHSELWHSRVAILLILSSIVTELCFLFSGLSTVQFMGWNVTSSLQLHRMGDSALTLAEYVTKLVTGLYIARYAGGVIHTDTLAWGGVRPVYLGRFAQWSVAVPILVLLTNRAFFPKGCTGKCVTRSLPALAAAFLFCWAAWAMEVTTSRPVRWIMFWLSLSGAVAVSLDQLALALSHRHDDLFSWKLFMLVYQLLSFAVLSTVFCLGRFGVLTSLSEQCIYAYCDASIKVFQGTILAMIRNREDLCSIKRWWVTALMASQDRDNLVQKAAVPVFALDVEGRIVEWNQSLQKLTGWSLEQVQEKPLVEVVCADSRDSAQLMINYVLESARKGEASVEDPSPPEVTGSSSTVSNFLAISVPVAAEHGSATEAERPARQLGMTLVPKSTEEGQLAGIMAIGQDLSELVELQMMQERKHAMMAMLSHEIRSPLHGIMGLTGAMLEMEAGRALERQLGMVNSCAVRLLDLVTNIMDLAQSEKMKHKGGLAPRPCDLVNFSAIADEVQAMTQAAVDKRNVPLLRPSVRLVNELAGAEVPLILGDPQKCTQLVYNLVTNACKFTDQGSVTIKARHNEEAQRLEVEVVDTGRGISQEGQKRIFQAFEQEETGDSRSFQGIGLGLAVCTEIAALHGGELRVRSELGRGSVFTASFPCDGSHGCGPARGGCEDDPPRPTCAADRALPTASAAESAGAATLAGPPPAAGRAVPAVNGVKGADLAAPAGPPLVLLVDDEEVHQEVVKNALRGLCELFCAMDGTRAIEFLAGRRDAGLKLPEAVLLDIRMPDMSGFEVCQAIRKRFEASHAKMPIVVLSAAWPAHKTLIEGYNAGMTDFVPKSLHPEAIRRKMGVVLEATQGLCDRGGGAAAEARCAAGELEEAEAARDWSERAARDLEEKLRRAELRADELQRRLTVAERRIEELQRQSGHVKSQQLERQLLRLQRQEVELQTTANTVPEQQAQTAGARVQQAAERETELMAQAQELHELLQEQYASAAEVASPPTGPEVPALEETELQRRSLQAAREDATQRPSESAADAEGPQRRLIGTLLWKLVTARAADTALNARLQRLRSAVQECIDLLRSPIAGLPFEVWGEELKEDHLRAQLKVYESTVHILSDHLTAMGQMAGSADNPASSILHDGISADLSNWLGKSIEFS